VDGELGEDGQVGPVGVGLIHQLADLVEVAIHLADRAVELCEGYTHPKASRGGPRVAVRYTRWGPALSRSDAIEEARHR
jgi:hypothetical protein